MILRSGRKHQPGRSARREKSCQQQEESVLPESCWHEVSVSVSVEREKNVTEEEEASEGTGNGERGEGR